MSVVVAIQTPFDGQAQVLLYRPDEHAFAGRPLKIEPQSIKDVQALVKALRQSANLADKKKISRRIGWALSRILVGHPAIKDDVVPLLDPAKPGPQPLYLYFWQKNSELEQLPWEALFSRGARFYAQNHKFGLARVQKFTSPKSEWLFEPPLKIMAVMGAASDRGGNKISATDQWERLWNAVDMSPIPIQLVVLTCEMGLKNTINGLHRPEVQAELIHDKVTLFDTIQKFAPHVLHFFCHGVSRPTPQMQLGTYKDWETDGPGSILIEAVHLKQRADPHGRIWLVTLNCCESADVETDPASSSASMVRDLVAAGIPTAVGMRERITGDFAHNFCGEFYGALLSDFQVWLDAAAGTGSAELHWAHSLYAARYPSDDDAMGWTVPVMHTRLEPFRLQLAGAANGMNRRAARERDRELLQLQEDVKLFDPARAAPVIEKIDHRIGEIKVDLGQAALHGPAAAAPIQLREPGDEKPGRALPALLGLNAYTGNGSVQGALADAHCWTLSHAPPMVRGFLRAPPNADIRDWEDERVGWGLVLPDNPALTVEQLATAIDAPAAIQELVSRRSKAGRPAPVLRYKAGARSIGFLRRDGADLPVSQSVYGTAPEAVPRYLLIYGTPEQIPWEVQYSLNASRFVGRLSLEGVALENYVAALLNGWKNSVADPKSALVWASDHGTGDITALMRRAVAQPMRALLLGDHDIGAGTHYLEAGAATALGLAHGLAQHRPGMIVTTSHGMTGPLDDVDLMRSQLGLLVDSAFQLVRPDQLLKDWAPGGAIWYAHACCGAGSARQSMFAGLLRADSSARQVLEGVALCGELVAPMPMALLGAADPLRAFVGHVEPTFNWTLEQPDTEQYTTGPLTRGLYNDLFQPAPVGMAMASIYSQLGGLYVDYERQLRVPSQSEMLYRLLIARDIQSTVVLGDPTAMLPL